MAIVLVITSLDELVQYRTNQGYVIMVSYEVALLNGSKMCLLKDYQINLEMLALTGTAEYDKLWEHV